MHRRGATRIALFLSVIPALAAAQPEAPPADPDEGGEIEMDEGDAAKADAPVQKPAKPTPDPVVATSTAAKADAAEPEGFSWVPFGYLRLQYRFVQNDPNVEFVGRDDGFELQNARVGVRGKLGERAAFVLSFDGAVEDRATLNDPEAELRAALRDAFVDVALGGSASLRAGYFRSLADPEALVGDTGRLTVDRPIESRGIRATEGFETAGLTPGRSQGLAIRLGNADTSSAARGGTGSGMGGAGGSPVGLELAVQNGGDELSANNDNDKPSASASVVTRLGEDSWLVGTGRYNPRSVGELPFRQDETDIGAAGGMQVAAGPVLFKAAFVFTRTSYPSTGGPASMALGGHGQLFFRVPGDLPMAFGYRFGILDPSSLIVSDRVMEHTVAGTVGVPRYRMRLQFQVTHVMEQASRALSNTRAQLAAEVSL